MPYSSFSNLKIWFISLNCYVPEGLDLASLASSPIGRVFNPNNIVNGNNNVQQQQQQQQMQANNYVNNSTYLQEDEGNEIPFDRSMHQQQYNQQQQYDDEGADADAGADATGYETYDQQGNQHADGAYDGALQGGEEEEEQDGLAGEQLDAENENEHDNDNPFEALQMQRETEYLGVLLGPLQVLPEEYAQHATNDLGDRLRQTVSFVYLLTSSF